MPIRVVEPICKLEVHPATESPRQGRRVPGDVAHDLLGMLTIIRGYTELLAAEPSQAVREKYCYSVLRSCSKATALVGNSLELSRIEEGGFVLAKKPIKLAPFLRDCLAGQNIKATNKGILLHLEVGETPTVCLDPACIERVLDNLLDNAIKFSRRGTTVTLAAAILTDCLALEVHDGGQGMPQDDIAFVFEAFKQGTSRPTGGENSTGLGLAIVRRLVEAHHGQVSVRSEVGLGSTFSVRLPLEKALA